MIFIGRVMAVNHESHSVDVVLIDDGRRIPGVQVMASSASSRTGLSDLPAMEPLEDPTADIRDQEMMAIVAIMPVGAVCLGFLHPHVSQLMFDAVRGVWRHTSDVYVSVDDDGNFELSHPSGTFIRIGMTPEHEDLTEKDFDKKWKIDRNTDKPVHVRMQVENNGVQKATVSVDPEGNIAVDSRATILLHADGELTLSSDVAIGLSAPRIFEN
ncbi:MAG: hypothetical protein HOL17_02515 [Gammaproteobacteria bacterium]|jgi:hypothetical protein|nr:hypothetical protein [Candidatus Neomarinimicrobiota bacterium]MBT4330369.1 hypothetical protein [Gammaproteobacteria bacterium]MBT5370577.1 hypothetical protein [Gammaproteobacteria bacterium]